MSRSRNGRNKCHNYRYVYRDASKREKQLKTAKLIIDKQLFIGATLPEKKTLQTVAKIGDKG